MGIYKITGAIVYTVWPDESDSDDDFAEAFDGVDRVHRVSQIVMAESRTAALAALESIPGALPPNCYWDRGDLDLLTVEPPPPAVAMRALGIPTLFELEPTP